MALKLANIYTVVGGILTEGTPNAAAPARQRVTQSPIRGGSSHAGDFTLYAFLEDGTSIDVTVWVRALGDEWYQLRPAATVLPNAAVKFAGVPPDSDIFVQMTAPVGAPTTFAYAFV